MLMCVCGAPLRSDVPLGKGEYVTAKAMGRYEEGQRAALLAAQQLGAGGEGHSFIHIHHVYSRRLHSSVFQSLSSPTTCIK